MPRPARHLIATAALAPCVLLMGCDGGEDLTVWQTKVRFADSILRGAEVGTAWTITAERFDDEEGVLVDVRLDDNDGRFYYAERAHILVDPAKDTVQLRLENVTGAIAEQDDKPGSGLYQSAMILTEPVSVPYNVTP